MIKQVLAPAAVVAAMAIPTASSAVTITSAGVSGDFVCDGPFGEPAAQVDVLAGGSFNAVFDDGDTGGTYCFDLVNSSDVSAMVTLVAASVAQLGSFAFFEGGVTTASGKSQLEFEVAEGESFNGMFSFLLEAGESVVFDWTFGDVTASGFSKPDFDFTIAATPVPLPAGVLLMGTALAGFGFARRMKKA